MILPDLPELEWLMQVKSSSVIKLLQIEIPATVVIHRRSFISLVNKQKENTRVGSVYSNQSMSGNLGLPLHLKATYTV